MSAPRVLTHLLKPSTVFHQPLYFVPGILGKILRAIPIVVITEGRLDFGTWEQIPMVNSMAVGENGS